MRSLSPWSVGVCVVFSPPPLECVPPLCASSPMLIMLAVTSVYVTHNGRLYMVTAVQILPIIFKNTRTNTGQSVAYCCTPGVPKLYADVESPWLHCVFGGSGCGCKNQTRVSVVSVRRGQTPCRRTAGHRGGGPLWTGGPTHGTHHAQSTCTHGRTHAQNAHTNHFNQPF